MQSILTLPPRSRRTATGARLATVACLAAICLLWAGLGASTARADSGTSVPITEAPDLEWGMKESWRNYVGYPLETSEGAGISKEFDVFPYYQLGWKFLAGSYDPADGTTILRYGGKVHWTAHEGILDVTFADPVVTISATEATICVDAWSKSQKTGEIEHFENADIADLDVSGISPVVEGGATTWTEIPSAGGADVETVFGGNYSPGVAFDHVSFSYQGPGEAPDLGEHWDEPGSSPLRLDGNTIVATNGFQLDFAWFLLDRDRRIAWFEQGKSPSEQGTRMYRAFSLDRMEALGQPLEITPDSPERVRRTMFYDSNTGRFFFESPDENFRWLKYSVDDEGWLGGVVEGAFPLLGQGPLMWNSVGEFAFNFNRNVPEGVANNDYDHHQWQLNTYKEQSDGSWVRQTYEVENGPTGLNEERYPLFSQIVEPKGLGAPDGSLIVLGAVQRSNDAAVPKPATVPGAYRITLDEAAGTAHVETVAGTEVKNTLGGLHDQILLGEGDQVVLTRSEGTAATPTQVQTVAVAAGSPAVAEPVVTLPGLETGGSTSFAVDREAGTIWIGGDKSQKITGVRGGRIIESQYFAERHPRGGPVMVGVDHAVYAQTNDGSPPEFGGSPIYGMGRFERLGISPEVTSDPASTTVSLGVGEESEQVTFTSTATGEPETGRQWQAKPPGASRFTDIPDETDETLSVAALRGMDGTEYRAIYENAAGGIASAAAELTVDYAPRIGLDVGNVAATEGQDATFSVLAEGNPEPEITWQRRDSEGFWQPIADGDDNFSGADEPNLTVLDTNTAQSGSLFRARVVNSVAHVYSRTAKLTVAPATEIPPEGLDLGNVSLDWTGNEELQGNAANGAPNYFSAGVSGGGEATYRSVDGNAAVYQVSSAGGESLATWSTRGAHVGNGGEQLARLHGGDAHIDADGSATVQWDGSFSVNFYGGLVPFTFTDPELTVDSDGTGTLKAEMSGCASGINDPSVCTPLAPVPGVTVADFSGAEIDPSGEVAFTPAYAGVEVDDVDPTKPQVRTGPGWGAWPQSFVSFHVQTGLAAYWYTSGSGFDAAKPPLPFVVDFQGEEAPGGPPPEQKPDTPTPPAQTPPQAGRGPGQPPARGSATAVKPVRLATVKRRQKLGGRRVAGVARISCPRGGACRVSAPKRVRVKLGKKRFGLRVLAPKRIAAAKKATLRLRFPKRALKELAKRKRAKVVVLRVSAGGQRYRLWVTLRRAGKGKVGVVHVGVRKLRGGGGADGPAVDRLGLPR
jgi:hypothetical protein